MIRKRLPILAGLLVVWSFAFAVPAFAAAPSNDTLAGIKQVSAPFNETISTTDATTDADDLDIAAGCDGVPALDASVWYEITPASDQFLVVDMSSSNYSAGAIVATGSSGNWTVQACGPGAVVWEAVGGETYTVLVFDDQQDGAGNGGSLTVNFEQVPPPPDVSLTVNPKGTFNAHTGSATIKGTVTCSGGPASDTFIDVFVRQKTGRLFIDGEGFIEGFACDGSTQPWSVEVSGFNGIFKGGKTATVTFAVACGEFLCGEGFDESVVSLSSKKK
ncbi:MAG: hypothetical protein ACJ77D_02660 [Chloroflexota bacterium]|jgi:hypothetical protein